MKSTGGNEVEALFSWSTSEKCWLYGSESGAAEGLTVSAVTDTEYNAINYGTGWWDSTTRTDVDSLGDASEKYTEYSNNPYPFNYRYLGTNFIVCSVSTRETANADVVIVPMLNVYSALTVADNNEISTW